MKCWIHDTKKRLIIEDVFDQQSQWKILKYDIQKFSIPYSKLIAKEKRKKHQELESKLNILEKSLSCDKNIEAYQKCDADLDEIYDNIAEGVKIRSKFQGYLESKKSTKYFINIKKSMQKNLPYEH